jgi:hypothetical protein
MNSFQMLLLLVDPAPHQILVDAVACESNTGGWLNGLIPLDASVCVISFVCACQ